MKKIQIENISFMYFAESDGFPPATVDGMPVNNHISPDRWRNIIENNLSDMRPAIWIPPQNPGLIPLPLFFLYWNDGADLNQLDEKVSEGAYTADVFDSAILTNVTATICLNNYDWGADTLVPENLYPDQAMKPIFEPRFFDRFDKEQCVRNCPGCGEPLNQKIVKILHVRDKPKFPGGLFFP